MILRINQISAMRLGLLLLVGLAHICGCSPLDSEDEGTTVTFEGITVTNDIAEVISTDPNDWCLNRVDSLCGPPDTTSVLSTCYSFGPAYPNPVTESINVPFSMPVHGLYKVSIEPPTNIVLPDSVALSYEGVDGAGFVTLRIIVTDWQPAIYRFHFEAGGVHCFGDVQVK